MRRSFDFPAETSVLTKIAEVIADAGYHAGFNDGEVGDIQLAVDEACTNTIVHGLKKDPDRTFRIEIRWVPDEIEILIRESGEPFDMSNVAVPDVKATIDKRPVGKLGVYFIRKMMDEVDFHVETNGLKTLRMVKRKLKI